MTGRDGTVDSSRPALSVIVMGYCNAATIVDSVGSVVSQTPADGSVEVVVVTSGDSGSAPAVAAAFPDIAVYDAPERLLPGGARNAGIDMATGDHVAFLAADCRAEPGWIAGRLAAHRAGHPVVAGAVGGTWPSRPWTWASLYLSYRDRLPSSRPAGAVRFPSPAIHGLSYRRSLFDDLGRFDATLRTGEDTDMARRLEERGIGAWFDPGVTLSHHGPGGTLELLRDQYRRGARFVRDADVERPDRLLRSESKRTVRSIRASFGAAWRDDRSRAVVAMPWIVAGALALRLGRVRAFRSPS